jgi:hypothetical protein
MFLAKNTPIRSLGIAIALLLTVRKHLRTGNEFDLATFYFQSWN